MASSTGSRLSRLRLVERDLEHVPDDASLLRALRRGDQHAAGLLWDAYSPLVRRVAKRTLGPGSSVEELVEEVFLLVLDRLRRPVACTPLRPLLLRITAHALRRELGRRRFARCVGLLLAPFRRKRRPCELGAEQAISAADPVSGAALRAVYCVLERLSPDARLTFALAHLEGLTSTELADALGISFREAEARLAVLRVAVGGLLAREIALRDYAMTNLIHESSWKQLRGET